MHKGKRIGMAVASLAVLSLAAPASATHGGIHPTFRLETDHMQCLAGNRIQNVGRIQGQVPTWSATAPTQTLAGGGGCIQYENIFSNTNPINPYDLVFTGTFTGNLKTITFELYYANPPQASVPEYFADAQLFIDGENVHTAAEYTFSPEAAGDAFEKIRFSYTKLEKLYAADLQEGDGDIEHEITITLASYNEQQMFFAWGATDTPTKVTFNPATPAATKLPVA